MWKIKVRRLLSKKLLDATQKTKDVSRRDIASIIGLSSGALSEIMNGKRTITTKTAKKIIDFLDLSTEEKAALLGEMNSNGESQKMKLDESSREIAVNWIYYAILSVLEIDSPPKTAEEISKRLGVALDNVSTALDHLAQKNYILKQSDNTYETLHKIFTTTDNESSPMLMERHQNNLVVASHALDELHVDQRDFTSITFPANTSKIEHGKREIRNFLNRLSADMSEGELDQVFQLNVQLFPLLDWPKAIKEK